MSIRDDVDIVEEPPPGVRKRSQPTMLKPEGLIFAKEFRKEDGNDSVFFERVGSIPPLFAKNPKTRIHAQHWRILYNDGDTDDIDRLQVKATLGLAKKLRDHGNVNCN